MKQTSKKSKCWILDHSVQTKNVKISKLHDFQGHPFRVEYNIQLFELLKSDELLEKQVGESRNQIARYTVSFTGKPDETPESVRGD